MTRFKDKYRVESTRLAGWNYASAGYYFVTICTHERACYLGEICNGAMVLSQQGIIVAEEWMRTEVMRENVVLDEWVIMPNHLHGIVVIRDISVETHNVETHCVETHCVETHRNASLQKQQTTNKFGPQKNNLASIIRGFKGCATKRIRETGFDFGWQTRYYEHVIRDEKSLGEIRLYIVNSTLLHSKKA
jgi:putative transposase